ncbi:MAG: ABC transporter substrate-binding protein [Balneolales bacterium]|nr:ABC transporter substrate-binding protein [Balneolales bacterium]
MRKILSLSAILAAILLLQACGSTPETVQVRDQARTIEPSGVVPAQEEQSDPFTLRIGDTHKPGSMDPLFAHNTSAQRLIRFVYDGLTGLDADGRAVPLLAESWEVSADSLQYTFTLRDDAFFHDDPAFAAGRGRSVLASDVEFVFARMALYNVPVYAGAFFSNYIKGMEAFLLEERHTFFDRDILFGEISGIEALDESRVRFTLNQPEPDFPAFLAHPYAVIYPREVFDHRSTGLHSQPVGTGAFQFASASGDTLIVLERNFIDFSPARAGERLTAVEWKYFESEAALFTAMGSARVDLIPQIGPQTAKTLLAETLHGLAPGYAAQYELLPAFTSRFGLYFMENNFAGTQAGTAAGILRPMLQDDFAAELPPNLSFELHPHWADLAAGTDDAAFNDGFEVLTGAWPAGYATYAAAYWLNQISDTHDVSLLIVNRPNRDMLFYMAADTHSRSLGLGTSNPPAVQFTQQNFGLHRTGISGITLNEVPWWISLSEFEVE